MIVVGILGERGGAVLEIARLAAAAGARTEVVGAAPTGERGDRLLLEVAKAGVGHATVTRSIGDAIGIEPADLDLALRYLPDVRAIVLVAPPPALLATGASASSFAGATLVLVGPVEAATLDALGMPSPIVLDAPARDPDGAFAGLVAALAVRLDRGEDAAAAWVATLADLAIEPTHPADRARA